MSYTPFDYIGVFPLFIYYIFLSVLALYLTIKMFIKWRERKVSAPLYLTIVFTIFTVALIGLTVGLAEGVFTSFYKELYRISLPFGYSMVIIANMFLFKFITEITESRKKYIIPIIIIGAVIILLLWLPWNWWGVPEIDYEGQLNIRLYTTLGLVLYSCLIYLYIGQICRKTTVSAVDKVAQVGLKLLFYSMLCMIGFFGMFIGDTILIVLFDHPGYSLFVYAAWIFAMGFYFLTYFSLVMPDWLIKRIKKESSKE